MDRLATTRPAGTRTAIRLCAAATSVLAALAVASGACAQATINQVQLGDVFAQQTLNVDEAPNGTSATTTAVGNSATAVGSGVAVNYQGSQELNAEVHAKGNLSVSGDSGTGLYVTSSATGNTATTGTCCAATTGNSTQTIDAYHGVTAESYAYAGNGADTVSVDSTALGNTTGYEAVNGAVNTSTTQTHYGTTDAETGANIGSANEASYTATAVGNNVTTDASNSSVNQSVSQTADGYATLANVSATQGSSIDTTAAATATANNINVVSDGYSAVLSSDQLSTKDVSANASLTLDNWSGSATSSAYGVANSAIVSNSGSYTGVTAEQTNQGAVTVTANLNGGAGGDALGSATGVGNAVSGYACVTCNGTVSATTTQTNSGGVSTTTTVTGHTVNSAAGISTAIGNTASFVVKSAS
jgi:hypothetical protein